MSGNDKNSNLYSASDIQKYLRGELSAPEMHQLELAALEDPFLSDALEGMEIHHSLPASSLQQDLGELQKRLDDKVGKKDRKGGILLLLRSPLRMAAAIILLLGLGLTAYFTFLNTARPKNAVAINQSSHTPPAPPPADSIVLEDRAVAKQQDVAKTFKKEEGPPGAGTPNQSRAARPAQGAISRPPAAAVKQTAPQDRDVAFEKKATQSRETAVSSDTVADVVAQAAPPKADKEMFASKKRANLLAERTAGLNPTSPSDQLVFTGKVIDQNKNPLPGAALYLAGNYAFNATTDKNGFFSLKLPKKDSAFKLTVAYVGYEQASLGLSVENRTGNVIQLQPQANAMNEVVVTGYGAKRREIFKDNSKPQKEFLSKKAVPADGWPAYQSYLEVNKKAVNPDSTLKGNETISFLVNKEGALSSFKVEQSLSPAHDSAAIQLIRQGPSWKLLKGKKIRAWVTIPF